MRGDREEERGESRTNLALWSETGVMSSNAEDRVRNQTLCLICEAEGLLFMKAPSLPCSCRRCHVSGLLHGRPFNEGKHQDEQDGLPKHNGNEKHVVQTVRLPDKETDHRIIEVLILVQILRRDGEDNVEKDEAHNEEEDVEDHRSSSSVGVQCPLDLLLLCIPLDQALVPLLCVPRHSLAPWILAIAVFPLVQCLLPLPSGGLFVLSRRVVTMHDRLAKEPEQRDEGITNRDDESDSKICFITRFIRASNAGEGEAVVGLVPEDSLAVRGDDGKLDGNEEDEDR